MNIEISLQEYFEELRLMEEQYGQEEDLYPWIYMLLQMAECVKKRKKEDYKGVSIRDVHLGSSKCKKAPEGISKQIKEQFMKTCPEFLVVDVKSENVLGCVEIKKTYDKDFYINSKGSNTEYSLKTYYSCRIDLETKEKRQELLALDIISKKYNKSTRIDLLKKRKGKNIFPLKIESENKEVMEEIVNDLKNKFKDIGEINIEEKKTYKFLDGHSYEGELLSHIISCKKVIYTNGKTFYYFKADKNNNVKLYEWVTLEKENERAFEELKRNLVNLCWDEEPTTIIRD